MGIWVAIYEKDIVLFWLMVSAIIFSFAVIFYFRHLGRKL